MLKHKATQSGTDSQPSMQNSVIEPGHDYPAAKKRRRDESDDVEEEDSLLISLLEDASAYLETAFKSKLDNTSRKAKATKFGIPNSRWNRCPKLDVVVAANVSKEATELLADCSNFG